MTTEQAIKWLKGLKANEILSATKEALDIAIKALETGEVYMTGEDYNLYMEGYKAGKRDFEPKQGEWLQKWKKYECSQCSYFVTPTENWLPNFCPNCGAEMKGGAE